MENENRATKHEPTYIGGQAVIEGVMMRGKRAYALAVRNPEGGITVEKTPIKQTNASSILKLPIFRGVVAFVSSLVMGTKILMRSAEIAGEDWAEDDLSKWEQWILDRFGDKINDVLIYVSVAISMALGVGLFFMLPTWLGGFFSTFVPVWALGVVEGVLRIAIFLVYLMLISRMKDIQRVFQYHGAEHKTINCFESGEALTVENVQKHTRLHKRCGTSFLLFVMVVSMLVFFFVQTDSVSMRVVSRIVLLPLVAGLSYEVTRWAGRSESVLVKWISYPGFCLQKITTAEPDASQIETAIASMQAVLEEEGIVSHER